MMKSDAGDENATTMVEENDEGELSIGLATSRSRRQPKPTGGTNRLEALRKLREMKQEGKKHKYEEDESQSKVYDIVDEDTYAKIVRERQRDDWIVDDGTGDYVEDGREIFDEEDEDYGTSKKGKGAKSKKQEAKKSEKSSKKSITNYFGTGSSKRKEEKAISADDDSLFDEMMGELSQAVTKRSQPKLITPEDDYYDRRSTVKSSRAHNPFGVSLPSRQSAPKRHASPPPPLVVPHTKPKVARTELRSSPEPSHDELVDDDDETKMEVPDDRINDIQSPTVVEPSTTELDLTEEDADMSAAVAFIQSEETEDDFKENMKEEPPDYLTDFMSFSLGTSDSVQTVTDAPAVDRSHLPMTEVNGEQCLRMYWLDAYEDSIKNPGTVYLFGRVPSPDDSCLSASCCAVFRNVERVQYFLPRETRFVNGHDTQEEVGFTDVFDEIKNALLKEGIAHFRARKTTKKYCLEEIGVPAEAEYLEIRYHAKLRPMAPDMTGETFSHVFGVSSTGLECFLLEKRLKGPGWVMIKNFAPISPPITFCDFEVSVEGGAVSPISDDDPTVTQLPPPIVCCVALRLLAVPKPSRHDQLEIIGACLSVKRNYRLDQPVAFDQRETEYQIYLSKPTGFAFPFDFKDQLQRMGKLSCIRMENNEKALLTVLLKKLETVNPDLIVGHDLIGNDLELLLHRLSALKVPLWSRLGRLRRAAQMPKIMHNKAAQADFTAGRLLVDAKQAASELIRCRSYDLTELVLRVLNKTRKELLPSDIVAKYKSSRELMSLIDWLAVDSFCCFRLIGELNAIPLFLQITQICGGIMSRTLLGGRAERNEYLLLHAFFERGYVLPEKAFLRKKHQNQLATTAHLEDGQEEDAGISSKKKTSYVGGLVLDPIKGLYDSFILLLDFNSLYPSIIQEYNICFTTVDRNSKASEDELAQIPNLPESGSPVGILPTEIRKLVESRREVKKLMKQPKIPTEQFMQYNVRQLALKLTANSMYGCLGFGMSRFYAKPLAALITAKGREILLHTKELVEQRLGLSVIYGDTDSIMINTNSQNFADVQAIGNKVKAEVNRLYRLLELDIDGIYARLLLLKKKKYAGVLIDAKGDRRQELKGLDIVRRDWALVAKNAGTVVVEEILSDKPREATVADIHQYLRKLGEDVRQGIIPLDQYCISKALTKNPADYPDKKTLPHVNVALRLNQTGQFGAKVKAGDTVAYVICEDGTNNPATQRAYHLQEVKQSDGALKIDVHYYLSQQIHPVVSRLCDPIEETDAAHIAECLGLDAAAYRQRMVESSRRNDDDDGEYSALKSLTDFSLCDPFDFHCFNSDCKTTISISAPLVGMGTEISFALEKCPQCKHALLTHVGQLENILRAKLRMAVKRMYNCDYHCADATCGYRSRRAPLRVTKDGRPLCPACRQNGLLREVTDKMVFDQLCYFKRVFDAKTDYVSRTDSERATLKSSSLYEEALDVYAKLHGVVEDALSSNDYQQVHCSKIFFIC